MSRFSHLIPPLEPSLFDLEDRLWLGHCMEGPMPRAAADALALIIQKELRPWEMAWETDFLGTHARFRQACAELAGVEASDISIMHSTSAGLATVANGFSWQEGDEVLLPLGEFPSNHMPWKALEARGVICREVVLWEGQKSGDKALESTPPDAADFESKIIGAIGPQTRIVALSWARFQDGVKLDLSRIGEACKALGVYLVVDGIQAAGTFRINLQNVSAFATAGHKGLLGPTGQGFLWTQADFRQQLIPTGTWLSRPAAFSQGGNQVQSAELWARDGRRLEPGGSSVLGCAALLESIKILLNAGMDRIEHHIIQLQILLLEELKKDLRWKSEAQRLLELRKQNQLGPTLCFHHSRLGLDYLEKLVARSSEYKITASLREGYLRVALHGWHSTDDIRRTLEWLHS